MGLGRKKSKREEKNLQNGIFSAGVMNAGFAAPTESHDYMKSVASDSLAIDYAIFHNYDFPFTNLVLEGGGMKGLAYVGVLQVLENANILENLTRICGVSIGSIVAMLVYVGYTPDETKEIMYENLGHIAEDHKCGYCSLLPGFIKYFGWNPGKRVEKWLKSKVIAKLGNGNCTFQEAYEKTGKEFCVVVTNLSRMVTEYFHVKTTPDCPIADAVVMSMSLPGYYQPRKLDKGNGVYDYYIDGGMFCNYPIHAFDGWWLSMKPEDSFFKKMSEIDDLSTVYSKSTRFNEWNPNTIGMLIYADDEIEIMKHKLISRQGAELPRAPKRSKKYRKRRNARHREEELKFEEEDILHAIKLLMKVINDIELTSVDRIPLNMLKKGIRKSPDFTETHLLLLFGCDNIDDAVKEMDNNEDGEITYNELTSFIERKGIDLYSRILGYSRREIASFGDFLSAIASGLSVCLLKSYVEDRDAERTIGVNSGYIETTDFEMEDSDKAYLLECGRVAARAYLREYCRNNQHRRRRSSRQLSITFFERLRRQSHVSNDFMNLIEIERQKMSHDVHYFPDIKEDEGDDDADESFENIESQIPEVIVTSTQGETIACENHELAE